jgi:hypothetical protein
LDDWSDDAPKPIIPLSLFLSPRLAHTITSAYGRRHRPTLCRSSTYKLSLTPCLPAPWFAPFVCNPLHRPTYQPSLAPRLSHPCLPHSRVTPLSVDANTAGSSIPLGCSTVLNVSILCNTALATMNAPWKLHRVSASPAGRGTLVTTTVATDRNLLRTPK